MELHPSKVVTGMRQRHDDAVIAQRRHSEAMIGVPDTGVVINTPGVIQPGVKFLRHPLKKVIIRFYQPDPGLHSVPYRFKPLQLQPAFFSNGLMPQAYAQEPLPAGVFLQEFPHHRGI